MKLLALDTATEACSVALMIDGDIREQFELEIKHSRRVLIMADELLNEAGLIPSQLDALAFGRGPGLFTGLRIGAGVAQGIAFAADLPVLPISSLAALAQGQAGDCILTAFDARMDEIYFAAYKRNAAGRVELLGQEVVTRADKIVAPEGGSWLGAGSGWDIYTDTLTARLQPGQGWIKAQHPHARDIAVLATADYEAGKAVSAEQALPVYLRNKVAMTIKERQAQD